MRTKLEQLKQLEAAYTEMQMIQTTDSGPAASASQITLSPCGRGDEMSRARAPVVEELEEESSVAPSSAPPPRPRPPKNYRYIQ